MKKFILAASVLVAVYSCKKKELLLKIKQNKALKLQNLLIKS
jgi:hypothetical protein